MIDLFANFSLLQSVSLLGLISICAPILIHLFNPNRGKLVLIGNIELIKKIKTFRIIETKISQWFLLLLRILILIILTLILADMVKIEIKAYSNKTHVFITPDWIKNANTPEKNNLIKEHVNDSVFLLTTDFPELQLKSATPFSQITQESDPYITFDALLSELDTKKNDSGNQLISEKNIIYLTNRMAQFSQQKTNRFSENNFDWRIKKLPLNILTDDFKVDIYYSPSRKVDYQYLKLAFKTLTKFSDSKLKISSYLIKNSNKMPTTLTRPDWIFWLNDDLAPLSIKQQVKAGSYLLSDLTDSSAYKPSARSISSVKVTHFWIEFYSALPDINASIITPIWFNEQGKVVLSSSNNGRGKSFQFNSRFNPNWTNITESIQFPWILAHILNESPLIRKQHRVSETELLSNYSVTTVHKHQLTSYRPILLLILCLLWLIERGISEKKIIVPKNQTTISKKGMPI